MLETYTVKLDQNVKQTIEKMTENRLKAVVVVDDEGTVVGLFSNGDMRNFFLKGGTLSASIREAMNSHPALFQNLEEVEEERKIQKRIIYPIVDRSGKLIDIVDDNVDEHSVMVNDSLKDVPLVIMAGGKGTRLYPYTKILPKPLIPIGDLTITERIIDTFRRFGCRQVYMILNHKASMIKAYINEIPKDYSVAYVDELKAQGTGGGLELLRGIVNSTFILSNCDILLNADFECAYLTHKAKGNAITFICAMKDFVIPYGVINTDADGRIVGMQEKPDYSFLVNTGVYVIEPEVMDYIQPGEFIGLPDLALRLMEHGKSVGVFPIPERSWMDMGQFSEMENMLKNLGIK